MIPSHPTGDEQAWANAVTTVQIVVVNQKAPTREASGRRPFEVDATALVEQDERSDLKRRLNAKVNSLRALRDGWDGGRGKAVSEAILAKALAALDCALQPLRSPRAPFIVPLADGGVQIEWHESHAELEISFFANGEVTALFEDLRTGTDQELEGNEALNLFLRRTPRVAEMAHHEVDVLGPAIQQRLLSVAA